MSTLLQLYLVRHGETAWTITGQHTGRTDLGLTAHGEAQARELAPRLRDIAFSGVLVSPARKLLVAFEHCRNQSQTIVNFSPEVDARVGPLVVNQKNVSQRCAYHECLLCMLSQDTQKHS